MALKEQLKIIADLDQQAQKVKTQSSNDAHNSSQTKEQ
jgi:hypothetical protein